MATSAGAWLASALARGKRVEFGMMVGRRRSEQGEHPDSIARGVLIWIPSGLARFIFILTWYLLYCHHITSCQTDAGSAAFHTGDGILRKPDGQLLPSFISSPTTTLPTLPDSSLATRVHRSLHVAGTKYCTLSGTNGKSDMQSEGPLIHSTHEHQHQESQPVQLGAQTRPFRLIRHLQYIHSSGAGTPLCLSPRKPARNHSTHQSSCLEKLPNARHSQTTGNI